MKYKQLIATLEEEQLKPRSYSGRGMYGAHCVGAYIDGYLGNYTLPQGWRSDNLGRGTIVYWPDVAWPEEK